MSDTYTKLASRLAAAYNDGPVPPLRDGLDALDNIGAYAVQKINTERWVKAGRRVVGRKIGLTSLAVQSQLGVDQPDFGVLFNDMQIADDGVLMPERVIQPKAEAEIAFVMANDVLDVNATPESVARAVDYVSPAIEIVDSRIEDWKITFADTVADNGSSAFFVLGQERRPLSELDLYTCGMVLEVNGSIASLGAGAACLGHPLHACTWLVRTLSQHGDGVKAGDIVLTGALGPMVVIKPGHDVTAKIGGLGQARFKFGNPA